MLQADKESIYTIRRELMVHEQIESRGVEDPLVLEAMRKVPRHLFVPAQYSEEAYLDGPLSIGEGQTISQPYVVGSMTAHLHLAPQSKVLEIGTGSGYQTAILAEIAEMVFSVERIQMLLTQADSALAKLGYHNIRTRLADGTLGWPEEAPFDAIIVTAAAKSIPEKLVEQLAIGGIMVIPIDRGVMGLQELVKVTRTEQGMDTKTLYPVRFVPLLEDTVH
jgi:protein-L-isoaspartate(D-aspartate) O-methyltransferase